MTHQIGKSDAFFVVRGYNSAVSSILTLRYYNVGNQYAAP